MSDLLYLYLYAREDQLFGILKDYALNISRAWGTNDITEGVLQGEEKQREVIKNYGYICLSKTCTSPAMWGYYADRSRGVCLVFVFEVQFSKNDREFIVLNKRKISKNPIIIKEVSYEKGRSISTDIKNLLFCKSEDWKHEQEYRIIFKLSDVDRKVDENGNVCFKTRSIMPYLKGVILGANCKKERAEVEAIISNTNQWYKGKEPKVMKAEMSKTDFNFIVPLNNIPVEEEDFFEEERHKRPLAKGVESLHI